MSLHMAATSACRTAVTRCKVVQRCINSSAVLFSPVNHHLHPVTKYGTNIIVDNSQVT